MTLLDAIDRLGAVRRRGPGAVRVAVVDSGVHASHPHVQRVAGGVSLVREQDPRDYVDRIGHGTAVAAAIREKAPAADIIAVKVFDTTLTTTAGILAEAIEWCARERIDIINLSLGTVSAESAARLQAAVLIARSAGAVIVSAADQEGAPSAPGSLEGVVSVALDWTCAREDVVVESATPTAVRVRASGYPRPIPGVPPERNLKGISFAVANASGAIAWEWGSGIGDQGSGIGDRGSGIGAER